MAHCQLIWGKGDYDLEFEPDDLGSFVGLVRRNYGSHFGRPLLMTEFCDSTEKANDELERMLALLAKGIKNGEVAGAN